MKKYIKTAPMGIKIISILYANIAIVIIIFNLISFYNLYIVNKSFNLGKTITSSTIIYEISLIIIGILLLFISKELWKGKNWAKISTIMFSILNTITGLIILITKKNTSVIFGIFLALIIGIYLLINKNAKQFFNKSKQKNQTT